MYQKLCAEFYDADKKFAAADELALYQRTFSKDLRLSHIVRDFLNSTESIKPLLNTVLTIDIKYSLLYGEKACLLQS
jgi:hypothetical protein